MPIDPSIPLSANPTATAGPDVGRAIAGANAMLALQQQQRAAQGQNALRQIFANPQALDPSGNPTPDALRQVMSVDPDAGMKLRQNMMVQQQHQLQAEMLKTKEFQQKLDLHAGAEEAGLVAYEQALSNGLAEPEARSVGQKAYGDRRDEVVKSGLFSEREQAALPTNFDPMRARSNVETLKDWREFQKQQQASARAARTEGRQDQQLALEKERLELERQKGPSTAQRAEQDAETIAGANIAAREKELGRPLTDAERASARQEARLAPKVQEQKEKDELKKIPDDVADNVAAQFVETGNPMVLAGFRRSPVMIAQLEGAILKKQKEAGKTPEQVARQSAEFAAYTQGVKSFEAGGKLEPIVRSLSVATGHLGVLGDAAEALNNGNVRLLNQLSNEWKRQTGSPGPTSFDGVKRIVSDEIVKAVVGSGGAFGDRESVQADLDKANSPKQLSDLVERYKQLMAGQLIGLRGTYNRLNTGRDFDANYLTPEAREQVSKYAPEKGAAKAAEGAPKFYKGSKPPPDFPDAKQGADGIWRVARDGKTMRVAE